MSKLLKIVGAIIILFIVFALGIAAGQSMLPPADQETVDLAIQETVASWPTSTALPTYTPQPTHAPIIITVERVVERERVITVMPPSPTNTPESTATPDPAEATAIAATATRRAEISAALTTTAQAGSWYEGGTLHDSTVRQWRSASYANKLATAADWATVMLSSDVGIGLPDSVDELRPYAEALVTCLDEGLMGEEGELVINSKTTQSAFICGALMGWVKGS